MGVLHHSIFQPTFEFTPTAQTTILLSKKQKQLVRIILHVAQDLHVTTPPSDILRSAVKLCPTAIIIDTDWHESMINITSYLQGIATHQKHSQFHQNSQLPFPNSERYDIKEFINFLNLLKTQLKDQSLLST
jgi:hypothetical protein